MCYKSLDLVCDWNTCTAHGQLAAKAFVTVRVLHVEGYHISYTFEFVTRFGNLEVEELLFFHSQHIFQKKSKRSIYKTKWIRFAPF